jgi:hypothetical protein
MQPQRLKPLVNTWLFRKTSICRLRLWIDMTTLSYAGYILVLIGGLLLVILGILSILGSPFLAYSPITALGSLAYGVMGIIIGIICMIGAKYVTTLAWAIILLVLGVIAGGLAGNIGGILVVLGALLGLISSLTRRRL